MKSAGKARNNGLYRHIRTSKEIIRNLLNDSIKNKKGNRTHPISLGKLRRILPQFTLIVYHIHCKNARKNDMFC